jgi:hypothetical protein
VPADVAQAVSEFMAAKDAAAVAAFAGALIDAAFDAMPESANRLQQTPPKANVSLRFGFDHGSSIMSAS